MDYRKVKNMESEIFDIVHKMHINLFLKNKIQYKLLLTALDELNNDYKKITGKYYICSQKIVDYYSKLWDNF